MPIRASLLGVTRPKLTGVVMGLGSGPGHGASISASTSDHLLLTADNSFIFYTDPQIRIDLEL